MPALLAIAAFAAPTLAPIELRCEALTNPLGIATQVPRLSWKLAALGDRQSLSQRSYHLLVASKPSLLRPGKADLWETSAKSRETVGIRYAGKPLADNQQAFWAVQVTDQAGTDSSWSAPATFSVGFTQPSSWKAEWIGFDRPYAEAKPYDVFEGAQWIWMTKNIPASFAKSFEVGAGLQKATLTLTADDHFRASLDGKEIAKGPDIEDAWKHPVTVDLGALTAGNHRLHVSAVNDRGEAGFLAVIQLTYADGRKVKIVTDETWRDKDDMGIVAPYGKGPWGKVGENGKHLPAPRLLRKEFPLHGGIKRAMLYGTALGLIEMHVNGKRVSDEYFMPGWSDYNKRVYSRAYDVTKMLRSGNNALGVALGDGWYSGYVGFGGRRDHYGTKTRAKVQLEVDYADGSHDTIVTDDSWKAGTGAMKFSDFLQGETYDANAEDAWDEVGYNAAVWSSVDRGAEMDPIVEPFPGQPVRAYTELKAKTIRKVGDDTYILNLGQNMAGFARLSVRGKPGQKIVLRFGERLNPDGTLYTINLRSAGATDTYICRGKGLETWTPSFTFHGFQYIEVTGMGKPSRNAVVGIPVSSDTPSVGHIETGDRMINQLVSNAWWTQRMNFIDVPTDCPQRDERLGWTGDAQAYVRTASMLTDVQPFFTKWLVALDDGQRADGQYPMVAPVKVAGDDGGPAWADAGVICPWTIYDVYGDKDLLAKHYPQMKKFVEFTRKRSTPDLLPPKEFHCFGDWLNINANTPSQVIYEAYFAGSVRLVAQAAEALGKPDEAAQYWDLYRRVRAAFQKAYVTSDGVVAGDTQCGYILALGFDLLETPQQKMAADRLVADIERRDWHLSTGFVGTRDIMIVLSKIGRNDVAYRLLHNKTFPSWGFTIENGATSVWERWDGWTPDKGFQDPGMNSFAHYAFGAVVGWMMATPAGITNLEPGFRSIRIAPQIDPKMKWLNSSYDSVRGKIVSNWRIQGMQVLMHVEVPPNVRAEVIVSPTRTVKVGSGSYDFVRELAASERP